MRIRDPIHGSITASNEEARVIDSRTFQRLRHVRQLGFGDLAFPGATHTRHAHSLGAMHVASRLFDAITARSSLEPRARERLRAAVRLAVLCHDIGHMPMSHASESIAPQRVKLRLPAWLEPATGQATHEDFTAMLLVDSELTRIIDDAYRPHGIDGALVASLPLVSVLGMILLWRARPDAENMAIHAEATFWYVLPSLPMFLVIPALLRRGTPFGVSLSCGCVLTVFLYLMMTWIAPRLGVKL
jgi:hypothetical protein